MKSDTVLSGAEAVQLIKWMRSVGHVERNIALDLMHDGKLTALHAEYFRRSVVGETYGEFKRAREGDK